MADRFVTQLPKITQIAISTAGPYIHGVYADGVRPLWGSEVRRGARSLGDP